MTERVSAEMPTDPKDARFCICGAERGHYGWQRCEPKPTITAATRTVEFAVEVVARMAIFNALDDIEWGNYPEIGEHDWQQVLDRIEVIGCGLKPMDDDYAEAYALLESRAEPEA